MALMSFYFLNSAIRKFPFSETNYVIFKLLHLSSKRRHEKLLFLTTKAPKSVELDATMILAEVIVVSLFVAACSALGIGMWITCKNAPEEQRKRRELEDRMMEKYGWCPSSNYYGRPLMF